MADGTKYAYLPEVTAIHLPKAPKASSKKMYKKVEIMLNRNRNPRKNAKMQMQGKESAPELKRNGTESRNKESKNWLPAIFPSEHDSFYGCRSYIIWVHRHLDRW